MENNARENFIQIITQLEKVLCDESHKTILNVDQHLNSINIKKSLKLGVVSALKDNLNKSLSLVFRVLEEKLEKKDINFIDLLLLLFYLPRQKKKYL